MRTDFLRGGNRLIRLASIVLAGVICRVSADQPILVEGGGAKISIDTSSDPSSQRDRLRISAMFGDESKEWRYDDLTVDPEKTGFAIAEIHKVKHDSFLFVHAYSGGASCCWSLLVFNLSARKPIGELLPSSSPIKIVTRGQQCKVGAVSYPIVDAAEQKAAIPRRSWSCFDGTHFKRSSAD